MDRVGSQGLGGLDLLDQALINREEIGCIGFLLQSPTYLARLPRAHITLHKRSVPCIVVGALVARSIVVGLDQFFHCSVPNPCRVGSIWSRPVWCNLTSIYHIVATTWGTQYIPYYVMGETKYLVSCDVGNGCDGCHLGLYRLSTRSRLTF